MKGRRSLLVGRSGERNGVQNEAFLDQANGVRENPRCHSVRVTLELGLLYVARHEKILRTSWWLQ